MSKGREKKHNEAKPRPTHSGGNRARRGVASIVAGAIIVAILMTTVFIYFLSVQQGEAIRSKAEIQSLQFKSEKASETFKVRSFELLFGGKIHVWVNNTGSAPLRVSQVVIYDENSIPWFTPLSGGLTINNDINKDVNTEFAADVSKKYRIDIITERGNIGSTTWPPPDETFNVEAVTTLAKFATQTLIAQGLGSIQLDFDSFGQIFPTDQTTGSTQFWLTTRDGVDQTGWQVKASEAPGYPAFRMPKDLPAYMVLRVKNMDASGEDITLFHDTGVVISLTKDQSVQQNPPVFLCNATETASSITVSGYDETVSNRRIILPNAADLSVGADERWVNLFICDKNVERGAANFDPTWSATISANSVPINPTFLVTRGEFTDSHRQYGQTIPYQAVTITDNYGSKFITCLKSLDTATPNCKSQSNDRYQAPQSAVNGTDGNPAYTVHLKVSCIYMDCGSGPALNKFTIDWIYPDGQYRSLGEDVTANPATGNILIAIPTTMADDSTPIETGHYIIQVTDFNDQAYYMTFRVTDG